MGKRKAGAIGPAIIVRVTPEQHAHIKKLAKSAGKSVSALVRDSVLGGKVAS